MSYNPLRTLWETVRDFGYPLKAMAAMEAQVNVLDLIAQSSAVSSTLSGSSSTTLYFNDKNTGGDLHTALQKLGIALKEYNG